MTISDCQSMVIEFIDTEEKLVEVIPVINSMLKTDAMILQNADILFNKG